MSKKANPTAIGAFVVGAIALIILTLIILGGGKFFSERARYVTYFDGSIQGLREGANVNFRGVRNFCSGTFSYFEIIFETCIDHRHIIRELEFPLHPR